MSQTRHSGRPISLKNGGSYRSNLAVAPPAPPFAPLHAQDIPIFCARLRHPEPTTALETTSPFVCDPSLGSTDDHFAHPNHENSLRNGTHY